MDVELRIPVVVVILVVLLIVLVIVAMSYRSFYASEHPFDCEHEKCWMGWSYRVGVYTTHFLFPQRQSQRVWKTPLSVSRNSICS